MRFTDAHSSSAVCTPTRYGILTGRYNWRSSLKSGVLNGYSKRLIEPGRLTVPEFLRQNGYRTACVGKWHLGMDWPRKDGNPRARSPPAGRSTTPGRSRTGRPPSVSTTISASAPRSTCPLIFSSIAIARRGFRPSRRHGCGRAPPGPISRPSMSCRPSSARRRRSSTRMPKRPGKASHSSSTFRCPAPHTPILPTPEWRGKSGLNDYADFVMQVDRGRRGDSRVAGNERAGRRDPGDLHQRQRLLAPGEVIPSCWRRGTTRAPAFAGRRRTSSKADIAFHSSFDGRARSSRGRPAIRSSA